MTKIMQHKASSALPDEDGPAFRRKHIDKSPSVYTVYITQAVGLDGRWEKTRIVIWTVAGITAGQCRELAGAQRQAVDAAEIWDIERAGKTQVNP